MKQLKELVQIVTRHRQPKPDFIDEEFLASTEEEHIIRFYHGIRQGKFATDQAAAEEIYGKPLIDAKYATLKSRLKSKLLNSLFFLNVTRKNYSELTVAYYKVSKMGFWMRTLSVLGAIRSSIKIAESLVGICKKYQFTTQLIDVLINLCLRYATSGQQNMYDSANNLLKQTLIQLNDELLAREYYERASLQLSKSSSVSIDFINYVDESYKSLQFRINDDNTFEFRIYCYRLGVYSLQLKREYQEVAKLSDIAIKYLNHNPLFSSTIRLGEFNLQKMESCLYTRNYELGENTSSQCKELLPTGSNLWFLYMEIYFLLAMQTDHYSKASQIYLEISNHERFQFQNDLTRERWKIFELYLEFAQRASAKQEVGKRLGTFDLKRFLRNVPVYSQDKRGLNVAILIIHILLLLEQNDFDAIISRMDALRTYRTRYLRSRSSSQSSLFFKMLQIMEKSSFSFKETERRTRRLFDQLVTIETDTSEIKEEIMVLRFETLWKLILGLLEQKERAGIIRV